MLIDLLFVIVGFILSIVIGIFSVIAFAIPGQIETAISYFANHLLYLKGIFPINTLLQCLVALYGFYVIYYGLKIALFFFAHLPFFGTKPSMPTVSERSGR